MIEVLSLLVALLKCDFIIDHAYVLLTIIIEEMSTIFCEHAKNFFFWITECNKLKSIFSIKPFIYDSQDYLSLVLFNICNGISSGWKLADFGYCHSLHKLIHSGNAVTSMIFIVVAFSTRNTLEIWCFCRLFRGSWFIKCRVEVRFLMVF